MIIFFLLIRDCTFCYLTFVFVFSVRFLFKNQDNHNWNNGHCHRNNSKALVRQHYLYHQLLDEEINDMEFVEWRNIVCSVLQFKKGKRGLSWQTATLNFGSKWVINQLCSCVKEAVWEHISKTLHRPPSQLIMDTDDTWQQLAEQWIQYLYHSSRNKISVML